MAPNPTRTPPCDDPVDAAESSGRLASYRGHVPPPTSSESHLQSRRFGLDKISFIVPITWFDGDPELWDEHRFRTKGRPGWGWRLTTEVKVGGATVHLTVSRSEGGYSARVEFNPSRVIDPNGISLCPVELLTDVILQVLDACRRHIEVASDAVDRARVTRLDAALDFPEVTSPAAWLLALTGVRVTYATVREVLYNRRGDAETYHVGSPKPGRVVLYDKHVTDPDIAPSGYLRWEVQARRGWLNQYAGITTVADITAESVERLTLNRWEWMHGRPRRPVAPTTHRRPLVDLALDFATGTEVTRRPDEEAGAHHAA